MLMHILTPTQIKTASVRSFVSGRRGVKNDTRLQMNAMQKKG